MSVRHDHCFRNSIFSADSVPTSVNSAVNLKAQGFEIVTVGFKSAGDFTSLSSQPGFNFKIHQDGDMSSVAALIGNVLSECCIFFAP